jgi:general secretion pathway protein G
VTRAGLGLACAIALLASAPAVHARSANAKCELAYFQVTKLTQVLELYRLDNGHYPTPEQGLGALVTAPTTEPLPLRYPSKGYVKQADLVDYWGQPFVFREPPPDAGDRPFDLYSTGENQLDENGAGDDLAFWRESPCPRSMSHGLGELLAFGAVLLGVLALAGFVLWLCAAWSFRRAFGATERTSRRLAWGIVATAFAVLLLALTYVAANLIV